MTHGPTKRRIKTDGLETKVRTQLNNSCNALGNQGRFIPARVRDWRGARIRNAGTRQLAKNIKRDIVQLRKDLDVIESVVCKELEETR
jgi:hypothetical protein